MLYEPTTGYSKITTVNNRTRAQILQLSNNLQEQLTTERTLLQYKIYPFIGGPKVSPLQNYGPIPTVEKVPLFGLLLGQAHSVVMARPSGRL